MYFLSKLKSLKLKTILTQFYRAVVESVLPNSITVWYDRETVYYKCRLQAEVGNAEMIINTKLPSPETFYINRVKKTTQNILNDVHHLAHIYDNFLPSNRRLKSFFLRGVKDSPKPAVFSPQSVKCYNGTKAIGTS